MSPVRTRDACRTHVTLLVPLLGNVYECDQCSLRPSPQNAAAVGSCIRVTFSTGWVSKTCGLISKGRDLWASFLLGALSGSLGPQSQKYLSSIRRARKYIGGNKEYLVFSFGRREGTK